MSCVRLAVPLNAPGEAAPLHAAGATEFYCGVQDAAWRRGFGDHDSISRRQGAANLPDTDALAQVLTETRALGAPLYLCLNADYTDAQLPQVLRLAGDFEAMGGEGLMAASPALMAALRERGSHLIIGLSLLAAVSSNAALRFYRTLGVHRVVVPRFLPIAQIPHVLEGHDGLETEAIVWLDKCPFIDGYCRFLHSVGYADAEARQPTCRISTWDMTYQLPACFDVFGFPPRTPACAACHLRQLREAGIQVFKLGGRGRLLSTRLAGVRFLRDSVEMDPAGIRRSYAKTFGAACVPQVCYYHA